MRTPFFALIVFVISVGCKSVEQIDRFDVTDKITEYDLIYSDKDDPLGQISDIEIVDGTIVTGHSNGDYFFSFIDAEKGESIAKWGRAGRGPGEYMQIPTGFSIHDSLLVFLDNTKKELNRVPMSDAMSHAVGYYGEPTPYTVDFRPWNMNIVGDKKIAIGAFTDDYFGILDSENNIVANTLEPPFEYDNVSALHRGSIFQTRIKSNGRRERFVLLTLASDVFEIYEVGNDAVFKIYQSPSNHIPKIHEKPRGDNLYAIDYDLSVAGLMRMAVSDELICFTYSSDSYTKMANAGKLSDEILCFDWDGRKVKKYILPFPVSHFCVDGNYLYGTAYRGDELCIYRFRMI